MKKIRWGLMGAGAILDRWMKGAMQFDDMEIVAIASRTIESAQRQAEKYGIKEINTYEELAARDDIDVVYINSIHPAHMELAIMAMEKGRNVLVEKPAAVNAKDFRRMAECARKNNVFLMEAVWTRFFPIFKEIKDVIDSGEIGEIRVIQSAFSFAGPDDNPSSRLFDMNQAGGSLLDVGVYNLNFAKIIMGKEPILLTGVCSKNTDNNQFGVDETAGVIAQYEGGAIAMMTSGIRADMSETAYIYGSKGSIEIPHFYKPEKATVTADGKVRTISSPVPQRLESVEDEGYQFEIQYVNEYLRNGIKESDVMPLDETERILSKCDELREMWGIKYPFEQ